MNNISIVGAGSMGALIGAALVKAGLKITFAGKPGSDYTQKLRKEGLKLTYANGESLHISPNHPRVRFTDTATDLIEKFNMIIVAVKSNNLTDVVDYIETNSTPDTILVHAQNGIPYWWFNDDNYLSSLDEDLYSKLSSRRYLSTVDSENVLQEKLGDRIIVGCVVKAPCHKSSMGIQVKKPPHLILGLTKNNNRYQKRKAKIQNLCELFSQNGLSATYTNKIRAAVCNKLAVNVTTNVLSALTGKVIAELTANRYTNNLIKTVIAETNSIFSVYGIKKEDLPTEQAVYSYINTPGSQSHLPSLAQDFAKGRSGEINLIATPVEMAQIAQVKVPTLFGLNKLLRICQTYVLKNHEYNCHILTLDNTFGYCILTDDVCQSSVVDKKQISDLQPYIVHFNQFSNKQFASYEQLIAS